MAAAAAVAHDAGALFVAVVDPLSLGVLAPPGEYGADIAVGEGQSLGGTQAFGGPGFGFMAARRDLLRRMPGRIVGETTDVDGKRGFVLTLQTREQHIRRENATSNICSNHMLNALAGLVYLSWLGRDGLPALALQLARTADYARARLLALPGVEPFTAGPVFREFALRLPRAGGRRRGRARRARLPRRPRPRPLLARARPRAAGRRERAAHGRRDRRLRRGAGRRCSADAPTPVAGGAA